MSKNTKKLILAMILTLVVAALILSFFVSAYATQRDMSHFIANSQRIFETIRKIVVPVGAFGLILGCVELHMSNGENDREIIHRILTMIICVAFISIIPELNHFIISALNIS